MQEQQISAAGHDLLENFETWPKHIQDSFLQMVSYQIIAQQELERAANLTMLDIVNDEFSSVLRVFSDKTQAFIAELQSSYDTRKFLEELADRESQLTRIRQIQEHLALLERILQVP